jgi:hypothetical protein
VCMEMSLELIPCNRVDVYVGVAVHLPPICCRSKELVLNKKNLLAIRALDNHELLLNSLEPIPGFHGILSLREIGAVSSRELSQMGLMRRWRWGCLLLMSLLDGLHVVESL